MLNCSTQIRKFHGEKVTIGEVIRQEMRNRRDQNRGKIKENLVGKLEVIGMRTQGSYAMHTMVQSKGNDFDIDDGIYFRAEDLKKADGFELKPAALRQKIKDALGDSKAEVKVKKNCVRVIYKAGYHVDIPAYKQIEDNDYNEHYKLASGDDWKESDPLDITKWFNNAVIAKSPETTNDGKQMRRIVRLLKYLIKSSEGWKNCAPSGFIISVLVDECYQAEKDRDDLSFYKTIYEIHNRLVRDSKVYHPILNFEELTKDKDSNKMESFKNKLKQRIDDLIELEGCTFEEAMKIWGEVFNEVDYFCNFPDPGNNSQGGKSGMAQPSSKNNVRVRKNGDNRQA